MDPARPWSWNRPETPMFSRRQPYPGTTKPQRPTSEPLSIETNIVKSGNSPVKIECCVWEEDTQERLRRDTLWQKSVKNFLVTTGLHGMSHIPRSTPKQKILWLMVVMFCSLCLAIHTSFLIYNASTRPKFFTTLTYETRDGDIVSTDESVPGYPGITLCSLSPLKTTGNESENITLPEYIFLSLGFPYLSVSMGKRQRILDVIMEKEKNKSSPFQEHMKILEKQFQEEANRKSIYEYVVNNSRSCMDTFDLCTWGLRKINCCEIFEPILTNIGLCHRLSKFDFAGSDVTLSSDLPMTIDLNYIDNNGDEYENGYYILIHDHRTIPRFLFIQDGTLVPPGSVINMKIAATLMDYTAKYKSFFGLKTECPQFDEFNKNYNKLDCMLQFASRAIKRFCRCNWILNLEKYEETDICGPIEMAECVMAKAEEIFSSTGKCPSPCIEYVYNADMSVAELTQKRDKKRSRVCLSYNGQNFFHNIYHRHSLSSLFSDIGGATGLLLGASAITGLETLILLSQWIYFKLWCRA